MSDAAASPSRGPHLTTLLIAVAVPLGLLMFVAWDTRFTLRLTTSAIQFKTAASNSNAGLFNSGATLELTVAGFDRLEGAGQGAIANTGGQVSCTFRGAELKEVDLTVPMDVRLEAADGALRMKLRRESGEAKSPFASLVSGASDPPSCIGDDRPHPGEPEWTIYGGEGNTSVILTLRPQAAEMPPEHNVPLEAESDVTFWTDDSASGLRKSEAGLRLIGLDRSLSLEEGQWLELRGLRGGRGPNR